MSEHEKKAVKISAAAVIYALVIATVAVMALNQYMIFSIGSALAAAPKKTSGTASTGPGGQLSLDEIVNTIIPKGVPPIYGSELGVSFDDPVGSLDKLASLDNQVSLSGEQLQRYTSIALKISCEYCCGAPAIVDSRGNAACGCAHSAAMRGLGKYLVNKHGSEYTDDQVLEELGKWKALFFPKQVINKAVSLQAAGEPVTIIGATSNLKKVSPATGAAAADGLSGLPEMVGGC